MLIDAGINEDASRIPDEVISVMGHELGHYALNHVVMGIVFYSLLTCFAIWCTNLAAAWALSRYGARTKVTELSDFASFPLALVLLGVISFVLSPPGLAFSRWMEHEADRFGLEITQNTEAFLKTEIAFVQKDLAYPRPPWIMKFLRSSHPTVGERFDFAKEYRPWEKGEPLVYGHLFKTPNP